MAASWPVAGAGLRSGAGESGQFPISAKEVVTLLVKSEMHGKASVITTFESQSSRGHASGRACSYGVGDRPPDIQSLSWRGLPETRAALPCSSCVEPPDYCPYTGICRVVPLSTSGPQGPRGERRRARRARAGAHEPPGRRAPWSVHMRRRDPPPVVNRRVGRPGPPPAAEAVHGWSGHHAQS
jgi:hypothetical protein